MLPSAQPLQRIHEGGNSIIYYQSGSEYGRPVVIKTPNTDQPSPQLLVRFHNEFLLTRDLAVSGVRRAIDRITFDDKPALVMEHFAGETVKQVFTRTMSV